MKPQSESSALPADLEAAARQLRAATQYKYVELWDTVPLRMQEGKETVQNLRLPGSRSAPVAAVATAEIYILPEAVITKDSNRFVRFQQLNVNFRIPYLMMPNSTSSQYQVVDVRLKTAGDFKEGQKTILGKLSGMEEETATFVVISLKVLD
jgi:hypothetical protein